MSRRFPGRRLSWWRVGAAALAVAALMATAAAGWFRLEDERAVQGRTAWFAGYVDATVTPFYPIQNPSHDPSASVVLSFVVASPEDACSPSWGGYYGFDDAEATMDLDRQIARLREAGGQVAVSFGGLLNDELATACTDPDRLAAAYRQVLDRYDLDMIDLDIEGDDLADRQSGERRAEAIAAVAREHTKDGQDLSVWLTLPVAPHGLTADGVEAVRQMLAAEVPLAGVNLMTMNYGESRAADQSMAEASIEAARSTHGQLQALYRDAGLEAGDRTTWSRIGLTPMIGQNDVPGEVFTLQDAAELNAFATEMGVGRMSLWSLNRDATCSDNYGDITLVSTGCSGVEQDDQTFASVLGRDLAESALLPTPSAASAAATSVASPTPRVDARDGALVDDPKTSPYPIWNEAAPYVQGDRVVWQRKVYTAKWWTQGDVPDDPVATGEATPWQLIGPVLPGETPQPVVTAPASVVEPWKAQVVYRQGDYVQLDGRVFQARWWTQADSPEAALQGAPGTPWNPLTNDEVTTLVQSGRTAPPRSTAPSTPATPTPSPTPTSPATER